MPILNLPPELLLHIFSLTSDFFPSYLYSQHHANHLTLLSLALVHSKFRSIAQELLSEEVWLQGGETMEEQARRLTQNERSAFKPRYLVINGNLDVVLKETGKGWWESVGYLRNGVRNPFAFERSKYEQPVEMDRFALSPRLHTLHLDFLSKSFRFTEPLCLQNLSRLTIGLATTRGPPLSSSISPASLPNLTKLGISISGESHLWDVDCFRHLFPQLTTLAIHHQNANFDQFPAVHHLPQCLNLKHLSLFTRTSTLVAALLISVEGLQLESLHIAASGRTRTLAENLVNFTSRIPGTTRIPRTTLYGDKAKLTRTWAQPELYGLEWREIKTGPVIAEFDGR